MPDGTKEDWGLHPATDTLGNTIIGSGEVRQEDSGQEPTASSGPISITEAQYNAFDFYRASPAIYSLPADLQCAQWALGGLMAAGVLPKIPTILLPTPFVNPATLAALFGILKLDASAIKAFI
jgi:hypothetical protein